jgi:hypothetical protein
MLSLGAAAGASEGTGGRRRRRRPKKKAKASVEYIVTDSSDSEQEDRPSHDSFVPSAAQPHEEIGSASLSLSSYHG